MLGAWRAGGHQVITSPDLMLRLWRHEVSRELGDMFEPGEASFRFLHAVHASMTHVVAAAARQKRHAAVAAAWGADMPSLRRATRGPGQAPPTPTALGIGEAMGLDSPLALHVPDAAATTAQALPPELHRLSQRVTDWVLVPRVSDHHNAALRRDVGVLEDSMWAVVHATAASTGRSASALASATSMVVDGKPSPSCGLGHALCPELGLEPAHRMTRQSSGDGVGAVRDDGSVAVPEVVFLDVLYQPATFKELEVRVGCWLDGGGGGGTCVASVRLTDAIHVPVCRNGSTPLPSRPRHAVVEVPTLEIPARMT